MCAISRQFDERRLVVEIYIDSANLDEIREAASWGILTGVTTNPSLVAKEKGIDFRSLIHEIATIIDGPISAEVISLEARGMVREGEELAAVHPNIVIKIPCTIEGLKAVSQLTLKDIRTNVTLCFNAVQALLAARAGASFISPFIGRVDDTGVDGMQLIREIRGVYETVSTQILAASIRHPRHIVESAMAGADIATCPFRVLQQSMSHPLTDIGIERFMADWKNRAT